MVILVKIESLVKGRNFEKYRNFGEKSKVW